MLTLCCEISSSDQVCSGKRGSFAAAHRICPTISGGEGSRMPDPVTGTVRKLVSKLYDSPGLTPYHPGTALRSCLRPSWQGIMNSARSRLPGQGAWSACPGVHVPSRLPNNQRATLEPLNTNLKAPTTNLGQCLVVSSNGHTEKNTMIASEIAQAATSGHLPLAPPQNVIL